MDVKWSRAIWLCLVLGVGLFAGSAWGADAAAAAAVPAAAIISASTLNLLWLIAPIGSCVGLLFAFIFYRQMMRASEGTDAMKKIAQHVREGAYAYLTAQYKVVAGVFGVLFLLFVILAFWGVQNPFVPVAFLTGGFFSGLCGFLGMKTATSASARTAQGASENLNAGLQIAFRSGAVMGLVVVGFGLLDVSLWYWGLSHIFETNMFGMSQSLAEHSGLLGVGEAWDPALLSQATFQKAKLVEITTTMLTFGMGASTQALFARVGGGIYTKAADVGADLVGKVEAGIPEDDPRNPATIADNVGDNVGDVAGMGADLYESYCGAILATATLGAALPVMAGEDGSRYVIAPMIVAGAGTFLSLIGIYLVRCGKDAGMTALMRALNMGVWISSVLLLGVCCLLAWVGLIEWSICMAVIVGLVAGIVIGQATEYYTSDEYAPTLGIVDQCRTGSATAIIDGLSVGMLSTGAPVLTIVFGILLSFGFAGGADAFNGDPAAFSRGLYGIGFAAVGMLSTLAITLAMDAYGPIADNAGGNAEMAGLPSEVRERTDALDMLGNTTAATGKGFAMGSAALTSLALLAAYLEEVRIWIGRSAMSSETGEYVVGKITFVREVSAAVDGKIHFAAATLSDFSTAYDLSVMNPKLICGIFIGAMMTFVFCAMTMKAVGRAAGAMVNEVRRQFREIPGILKGTAEPEYARCVEISTQGAQREMVMPSVIAIAVPVVVGLLLGVAGVIGLIVGGITTGFTLACMLNNAGGAWDNAKKHIEKEAVTYAADAKEGDAPITGRGSRAHAAGVVGDTVGDPFKDTSGPSLNILIKLMTMVSVVFCGLIVKYGDILVAWATK